MISKKKLVKAKTANKAQPNPVFAQRYDGTVECPWCTSMNSKLSNPFGSTVSEMIFTCTDCGDTFGWMKWQQRRDHNESSDHNEGGNHSDTQTERHNDEPK